MKKFNLISFVAVLTALICFNGRASGTVHRVNNNPAYSQYTGSVVFTDLNAAIADPSVGSGDTLYVEASGTSYGNITINKPVTIIGTGYFLNENSGWQQNQVSSTVSKVFFDWNSS